MQGKKAVISVENELQDHDNSNNVDERLHRLKQEEHELIDQISTQNNKTSPINDLNSSSHVQNIVNQINRHEDKSEYSTDKNTGKRQRPNFLDKLGEILDDPTNSKYICWNKNGEIVVINDIQGFTTKILSRVFSHQNFNSFIRQLNMYGFRKQVAKANTATYKNQLFCRDRPELRKNIVRSTTKALRQADREVEECKEEMYQAINALDQLDAELQQASARQKEMIELSTHVQQTANELQRRNLEVWGSLATLRKQKSTESCNEIRKTSFPSSSSSSSPSFIQQNEKTRKRYYHDMGNPNEKYAGNKNTKKRLHSNPISCGNLNLHPKAISYNNKDSIIINSNETSSTNEKDNQDEEASTKK